MFYVCKMIKYREKSEGRFGLRNSFNGSKLFTQVFRSILLNGRKSWDRKKLIKSIVYRRRIGLNATLLLFCFLFVWNEPIVVPGFKHSR